MMNAPDTTHVYPLNDMREHIVDGGTCWCKPRVEYCGFGRVVVHNSADGREAYERGERKPH